MTVEIRRASPRFVTKEPGRFTRHAFSFGSHYDPENVAFGPLICHDDHWLGPGRGFVEHSHADVEIVSWVLDGVVVHSHDKGAPSYLRPGTVQVLSAGGGVTHTETAAEFGSARFVQMWLTPDRPGTPPELRRTPVKIPEGEWTLVASGRDLPGVACVGTRGADLWVARLPEGGTITLPQHPRQHVYVAKGALRRSSLAQPLGEGDAYRISEHPGLELTAAVPTELLVWTFAS
ncbi:pirin family protein [Nocardioides sp.]|uniref:pirin family protein n=1 Tax=Nocardioides sp. TaxID=35761 RepID=UPI0035697324